MTLPILRLKKNEERRLQAGHLWIYSNEVDTALKNFTSGQEVTVEAYDKTQLGSAYVNPHSLITARLFSRVPNQRLDYDYFKEKIQNALRLRESIFKSPYYRLVFSEGDFLPGLILDRFNTIFVMQANTAGIDKKTDTIIKVLLDIFLDTESIILRNDSSSREIEGLPKEIKTVFGNAPEKIQLEENGLYFYAPLLTGQKTGWFYDHRFNRSRLKLYANNKRILDVFSYLGGWGIQAASWNAKEVVCLDSSATAGTLINENARLNQVEEKVSIIIDDAFDGLKKLNQSHEKFDLIILDPPAFVKKIRDKKEGMIAYQRINEYALKLLKTDGILISCSCSMHMSFDDLLQAIRRAALQARCHVQVLERGHQAPDHPVHIAIPETDYLKMVILRKYQGFPLNLGWPT